MPADDRRMQAASYVAQLVKRFRHFAPSVFQPVLGTGIVVRLLGKQAEFECEGNQALLCTVVEISVQTATLVLLGLDPPATRVLKLPQPSPKFSFQPAVLQRDAG